MSELREKTINEKLEECYEVIPAPFNHDITARIIVVIKEHIEECEKPKNPNKNYIVDMPSIVEDKLINIAYMAWGNGVEADRKKLLDSLST